MFANIGDLTSNIISSEKNLPLARNLRKSTKIRLSQVFLEPIQKPVHASRGRISRGLLVCTITQQNCLFERAGRKKEGKIATPTNCILQV